MIILISTNLEITQAQDLNITISRDTFKVNTIGKLSKVAIFHDKFYCLFSSPRKNTWITYKNMFVIDKSGQFIENVYLPEEIQNLVDFEIIVEQDSLFIKDRSYHRNTYKLDNIIANFKLFNKKEFQLYKDNIYKVSSKCRGEWGGFVYFENKHSGIKYKGTATCPVVINKLENVYYVTNYLAHMIGHSSVLKIENPERLAEVNSDEETYSNSYSLQGIKTLIDTFGLRIFSSMVIDNKLVHLYSDKHGTYIGEIINNKLIPIYKFDFRFSAELTSQTTGDKQVFTCYFNDSYKYGILEIIGNRFSFYEFH